MGGQKPIRNHPGPGPSHTAAVVPRTEMGTRGWGKMDCFARRQISRYKLLPTQ